jgi:hypothetical protein
MCREHSISVWGTHAAVKCCLVSAFVFSYTQIYGKFRRAICVPIWLSSTAQKLDRFHASAKPCGEAVFHMWTIMLWKLYESLILIVDIS